MKKLFVGNLSWKTSEDDFEKAVRKVRRSRFRKNYR